MREEAPNKKLPPKKSNDEILSSLYRHNIFDSIKDESLDIDISACVTINADGLINGSSLSSSDFWRVLDESARNSELDDMLMSSHESSSSLRDLLHDKDTNNSCSSMKNLINGVCKVKEEQPSSFSGTFLRPETPVSFISPVKKTIVKPLPSAEPRQLKIKSFLTANTDSKEVKLSEIIKEESLNQNDKDAQKVVNNTQTISTPSLSFQSIQTTSNAVDVAPTTTNTVVAKQEKETTPVVETTPTLLYKCIDCDSRILNDRQEYVTHHLAKHRITFVCSECRREFEQEVGLKKHFRSHRSAEARKDTWKKCPDCGKSLKHGSMWMHRKIHSDNKQYGCDVCGLKFVQKINLTHHSRIHSAEKPYECPECQKRFQERSHLQRHQKYHAQTRSFRCEKCGKMYKTERCLKVHNLVHLEQRPFACKVCDKSFISNSKLKQHSNIHTGERPFKCNYCPRDFTNFPNWLKHTRRRHKVDHKTGEQLENIPSYCSKKSTKAVKTVPKAAATVRAKIEPKPTGATATKEIAPKPQVKRTYNKKLPPMNITIVTSDHIDVQTQTTSDNACVGDLAAQKIKRERKQLTPKQVQKTPIKEKSPVANNSNTNTDIKREVVNFPDLHMLSITSAEEFIMEQALQMEECGLYESPGVDTDNAISAETAAEMHFKIKREVSIKDIKKEEDFALQNTKQRLLCSSLDSSPYSSPASGDVIITKLADAVPLRCDTFPTEISTNGNSFFLPSITISNQNSLSSKLLNELDDNSTISHINIDTTTLLQQIPTMQFEEAQLQSHHNSTQPTQTLLNQLYLPMTVNMPFIVQPNQVLPSVDTLLFSTHNNSGKYLCGKSNAHATAQHNLT